LVSSIEARHKNWMRISHEGKFGSLFSIKAAYE
jgi:hypothetical protein